MTEQYNPTDAQLVALAEQLGFEVYVPPKHTKMPPWLMNPTGQPIRWLTTPEGAFAIQSAMARLGWRFWVRSYVMSYGAAFYRPEGDETEFAVEGDTAPDAIVLAARTALDKERIR